jgi:hypothetical protein
MGGAVEGFMLAPKMMKLPVKPKAYWRGKGKQEGARWTGLFRRYARMIPQCMRVTPVSQHESA